ncbi:hypothetical protein KSP39_PZI015143 [Platanthera zijinensis]|uniref:Uncharacterized protein n=1 Tax=Platanthera zijinensis TaxID=2320716 RepID=A0AAP0BB01_9ASPA
MIASFCFLESFSPWYCSCLFLYGICLSLRLDLRGLEDPLLLGIQATTSRFLGSFLKMGFHFCCSEDVNLKMSFGFSFYCRTIIYFLLYPEFIHHLIVKLKFF